jgi:hypothetical protein
MKLDRRDFEKRLINKLDGGRDVLVPAADLELLLTHARRMQLRVHKLELKVQEYKLKVRTNRVRLTQRLKERAHADWNNRQSEER